MPEGRHRQFALATVSHRQCHYAQAFPVRQWVVWREKAIAVGDFVAFEHSELVVGESRARWVIGIAHQTQNELDRFKL